MRCPAGLVAGASGTSRRNGGESIIRSSVNQGWSGRRRRNSRRAGGHNTVGLASQIRGQIEHPHETQFPRQVALEGLSRVPSGGILRGTVEDEDVCAPRVSALRFRDKNVAPPLRHSPELKWLCKDNWQYKMTAEP